jgi:glyoxylase-like metal-dependent hydrolase (beta-lactamase superfamily II)
MTPEDSGIKYEGGDGRSADSAIIIRGAADSADGITSEYGWLERNYPGATLRMQSLRQEGDRMYDVLEERARKSGSTSPTSLEPEPCTIMLKTVWSSTDIVLALCAITLLFPGPGTLSAQDPVLARADSLREAYSEHPGLGSPVVHRLADNVYAITGLFHSSGDPGVNAGVVFGENSVVFVDCGMSVSSGQFLWELASVRMTGNEAVYLILTHHHSDHVFGMSVFREKRATIIAHSVTGWFLRERGGQYKTFIANMEGWSEEEADSILGVVKLSAPDVMIEDDYVLGIDGDTLHILVTPGHVAGELAVYHPESGILFAGDALYEGMAPTTRFGGADEWRTWVVQLERLKQLQLGAVVPGHGQLSSSQLLDDNIEHLRMLLRDVR